MNVPVSTSDATVLAAAAVVVLQYLLNHVFPKKLSDDVTRFIKAGSAILVLPGVMVYAVAFATSHQSFLHQYPWVSFAAGVLYYVAEAFVALGKSSVSNEASLPLVENP